MWVARLVTQAAVDREIANVFAGLFTVILIGLVVENLIFRTIEQRTIRKWGMQH